MRNPDGGVHELRKKAEAGLLDETSPTEMLSWPTEGYQTDLSRAPKVTFATIWRFMIESIECKKQIATAKPLVKGYNFYMSNHVLAMYHISKDSKHFIKSKVLPSMKKSKIYSCFIKMSSLGMVLAAKCGCPAGINGRCNHVCATLFYLESLGKKKQQATSTDSNNDVSCTSKPCKWTVPSKRKGPIEPIQNIKFKKHNFYKLKKDRIMKEKVDVPQYNLKECQWSESRLQDMLEKLKKIQTETGKMIGWCQILPQEIPDESTHVKEPELLSPIKDNPISQQGIRERIDKAKGKLFVDEQQASLIEKETKGQSVSDSWHFHRAFRITASKCYRTAVLKESTSPTKAVKEVLYNKVVATKQMRKGLEMESHIKEIYENKQNSCGHKGLSVTTSGLVVGNYEDGFLGASPDGIVHDPSVADSKGLLEMKYIDMDEGEHLSDSLIRKNICSRNNSILNLKQNHKYFYQIQQGMYLTKTKWTDFVVGGSETSDVYIERVAFDSEWWASVKQKIELFFERYVLPEIAYPRIKYGLTRLELRDV